MSICVASCRHRRYCVVPFERSLYRVFDKAFDDFFNGGKFSRSIAPYWFNQPLSQQCNIGNSIGKIINDEEKFSVEIDASQFHPSELSVNIREKELIVEGKHEERNDENGTIQRHFIRKYEIPSDVQMDTIESNLSDKGVLSINARKVPSDNVPVRRIPIKSSPPSNDNQKSDKQEVK